MPRTAPKHRPGKRLATLPPRLKEVGPRLQSPQDAKGETYGQGRGGRPWRRLRDAVLLRDKFTCQSCKRLFLPSDLACDHIVPIAKGGTDAMCNLQALCDGPGSCHEAKTIRDKGGKPKVKIGLDGWPVDR